MHGGWFVVAPVVLPLFVRAAVTGALLGAFVGAAITLLSLVTQPHGSIWRGFTQMVVLGMIGLFVGALAGLVTCVGALIGLRLNPRISSPGKSPGTRAGALGAGIMTTIYVGFGLTLVGNLPLPSFVIATGFGMVAASLAAFQIRRLVDQRTLA